MARLLCLLVFLCSILAAPAFGTRFVEDQVLRMELTHWDSPSVRDNSKSLTERLTSVAAWSHARAEMHSRGQRQHNGSYTAPLTGGGGGYLMELAVGSPAQKLKVIADTGSDLVWVKIDECFTCNGTFFDTERSSTFEPVPCTSPSCHETGLYGDYTYCFSNLVSAELPKQCGSFYFYGSGVAVVYLGTETITMTSTKHHKKNTKSFPNVLIGGANAYYGFGDLTSGIAGLGQGPLSLVSQLGAAIDNKFSYCLVDLQTSNHTSPLLFGEAAKLSGEGIQSTPILVDKDYPTYYEVKLQGMKVGKETVDFSLDRGTTIFDSGTTLTYLEFTEFEKFSAVFKNLTAELPVVEVFLFELCYNMTGIDKDYKFPSISFNFDGATLEAPAANYLLHGDEGIACLSIVSTGGISIIGNLMQQNFHVLYDRDEAMLSFVPAQCDKL